MRKLNAATMPAVAGSPCRLPRPISFPDGRGLARIRVEAAVTLQQTNATAQTLLGSSVLSMVACLFSVLTTRFGDRSPEVVDSSLPFARARELFQALTGDDFLVICATYNGGAPRRLRDVLAADVIAPSTAQNGLVQITFDVGRAFEVAALGPAAYAYAPGASQARQIQVDIVRGATFDPTGNWVQASPATYTFLADDFELSHDRWASVPRIVQQEEGGMVSHGPSTPAGLLGMWEYGYPGANTPLTLCSVTRGADAPLHESVEAARIVRDALYQLPPGGYGGSAYDLNAQVTVLASLPADADREDVPVGGDWQLRQTGSELSPPRTAWLHIPVRSQADWDEFAGANLADALGTKLSGATVLGRGTLPPGPSAIEPLVVIRPGDPRFETAPGRLYVLGSPPVTHLPDAVVVAARGQVGAHGSVEGRAAASTVVAGAVAAALPGGQSGIRGQAGPAVAQIASRLGV